MGLHTHKRNKGLHWMRKGQQMQLIWVSMFYSQSHRELVLKNNVHCVEQKHNTTPSFPEAVLENPTPREGGESTTRAHTDVHAG